MFQPKDIEFMERKIEDLEKSMKRSNDKQLKVEHECSQKVCVFLELYLLFSFSLSVYNSTTVVLLVFGIYFSFMCVRVLCTLSFQREHAVYFFYMYCSKR